MPGNTITSSTCSDCGCICDAGANGPCGCVCDECCDTTTNPDDWDHERRNGDADFRACHIAEALMPEGGEVSHLRRAKNEDPAPPGVGEQPERSGPMTIIIPERLAALDTITLDEGPHATWESGHCAMEVVAWLAGEGMTDAPECASPVLQKYTVGLNDAWPEHVRQRLVPFLPRMVGTAGDGQDEARSYMALDWAIRTYTPAWLDLAGRDAEAEALRGLRPIVDREAAEAAGPVVRDALSKIATRAAALDAAQVAAQVAALAAARDAALAAAQAAALAAAWDAALDAALDAARIAARIAALDAEGAAARDALRPAVETLQESAIDLLDRMIDPAEAAR